MSISAFALQTKFNVKNAMASHTLHDLMKVRKETIRESMADFEHDEHRLEDVLRINGVQYINDSRAVNVNATFYALDSVETSIIWIAGGIDKGNDYEWIIDPLDGTTNFLYGVPQFAVSGNTVDFMIETDRIEDAVKIAYKLSDGGESVLLSPACASYDLFENFEERGKLFKQAVRQL